MKTFPMMKRAKNQTHIDECVIVPINPKKNADSKYNHPKSTSDTSGQNTHVYCDHCDNYTQAHLSNVSLREKEE
ncbi:hypothetical protein GLOIN_2v1486406 [Rhizophagus irregularis DAOM 181602=DAOM 197198]|uniref:Uncharacterized protein n=3 Tax=Rhizophagus irregularis TaxID=588596 RepID=A0A015JZN7_RHIIW|nr:hypothetical protein RirG_065590 [Rhizophagus irregularis DAOM 197198w]GET65302.1 hypothetical protein GLOIN_2v1486406 [Rhizophagus irregularis DAOM 181602=DAOM 197198]